MLPILSDKGENSRTNEIPNFLKISDLDIVYPLGIRHTNKVSSRESIRRAETSLSLLCLVVGHFETTRGSANLDTIITSRAFY